MKGNAGSGRITDFSSTDTPSRMDEWRCHLTAPMRSGEMIARHTQLVTLNEEWCSRLLSNPIQVFPEQGCFGSSVSC